jgi:DNA-binding winged helix-turn-helix (wHTH) protein
LPSQPLSFGPFEFDPIRRELRKHGTSIKLDPQAARLLELLLEEPGRLFSYEDIQVRLWERTVVEYGKGIRRCLSQIRMALGDNPRAPVYIQAERKRGCRFIAPVRTCLIQSQHTPLDGASASGREERRHPGDPATFARQAAILGLPPWAPRYLLGGAAVAIFAVLVMAVLTSAYGLAIFVFWLGAVFVILGYLDFEDRPMARAVAAVYIILAMSYTASASTMPTFQATVINVKTLAPSAAFLFVMGLKFIPLVVLVLAYWVILGHYGNAGFLAKPGLEKAYMLLGGLFLSTTLICVAWTSGDDNVWRARLQGRWTLVIGAAVVGAANLAVWVAARQCFRRERISSYRPLFWVCTAAYLPIALGAFCIDDEHNRINQYDLDVRWPEAYVAANPDAAKDLGDPRRDTLGTGVGLDLRNLLNDVEFREALRHGTFYKQHSDEPFQFFSQAVMFGYRHSSSAPHGRPPFVVVRFPQELAAALRFEPVGDGK